MKSSRFLLTVMLLAGSWALAADVDRDKLLQQTRQASSLDVLASYENSQMMLLYAELAQSGVTIQTPEGKISKRKAKKLVKEHQLKLEVMEQVMQERGYRNLEGDYRFEVKGDCEGAKAWWAALGGSEQCQDPVIHQDKMEVTVIHSCSHEGRTVELEQVGKTLGDAVVFVEELNSDLHYLGNISDGVITLHVDAERVLASWPSFEKAPTRKALKSCAIVMTPKSIQTNTD